MISRITIASFIILVTHSCVESTDEKVIDSFPTTLYFDTTFILSMSAYNNEEEIDFEAIFDFFPVPRVNDFSFLQEPNIDTISIVSSILADKISVNDKLDFRTENSCDIEISSSFFEIIGSAEDWPIDIDSTRVFGRPSEFFVTLNNLGPSRLLSRRYVQSGNEFIHDRKFIYMIDSTRNSLAGYGFSFNSNDVNLLRYSLDEGDIMGIIDLQTVMRVAE